MELLIFEPLSSFHTDDLLSLWSDEDVIRFTAIETPCTKQEAENKVRLLKDFDVFVVRRVEKMIGICGCPCIDKPSLQFGLFYQLHTFAWGQGYATQITAWLLQYMKEKYKSPTILADVYADNLASEKILKHFGFAYLSQEDALVKGSYKTKIRHFQLQL